MNIYLDGFKGNPSAFGLGETIHTYEDRHKGGDYGKSKQDLAAVGSASITNETLAADNDLMISGIDFWAGGTAVGDPHPNVWLEPSKEVPYVVVRDQVALMVSIDIAMSNSANVNVRLECATATLDQSTLNQLLRTQTV